MDAGVPGMERIPKQRVAGSNPVSGSRFIEAFRSVFLSSGPRTLSLLVQAVPVILERHRQAAKSVGSTINKVGVRWQQVR